MSKVSMLSFEESCEIVKQNWKEHVFGTLTDKDIREAFYSNDIFIHPFEEKMLTGVGYNLRPSELIISTKTGMPLQIREENNVRYVMVGPHDTVLISTVEYISVSERIMGTFHSRVSVVSEGFGHISTTLDPNWNGPLLIALNNPSSSKKKLILSVGKEKVAFATLIFYHNYNKAEKVHDNKPNRIDILMNYRAKPKKLRRFIFAKQYTHYDKFINELIDLSNGLAEDAASKTSEVLQNAINIIELLQGMLIDSEDQLPEVHKQKLGGINCQNFYNLQLHNPSILTLREMIYMAGKVFSEIDKEKCTQNFINIDHFVQSYSTYLESCLIRIRDENKAEAWKSAYDQLVKQAQSKTLQNRFLYLVLEKGGFYYVRIIVSFLILLLLVGFYINYFSNNLPLNTWLQAIAGPSLSFLLGWFLSMFSKNA